MKIVTVIATLTLVTPLAACANETGDDRPEVVAAFYPYAYIAEQIGGSTVNVDMLTRPGVDAHDLELKPKQVASIQEAAVVIYQSDFQAAVDDAVDQADRSADVTVDAATSVEEPEGAEHADEAEHAEDHEGHDHGDLDPHAWLNPEFMATVADEVAAALSAAAPEHAKKYQANAQRLTAELRGLDDEFADGLKNCERRSIVTSHAAFGHLAARYDLTQIPIAGIDPSNEPSGRQLASISNEVDDLGITTIFTEELVDPANAETIATSTGATVAKLDPIEGLGDGTSDEDYVSLMKQNLDALRKANGCT